MRERIKQVIKDTFKLTNVPDDISQRNCEIWDSLHHLDLIVSLELEFDISFEPEDIGSMRSLDEVVEIITKVDQGLKNK